MPERDVVIGLEVHVQLGTETKLYCRCQNEFGADPNRNTCPVCLGLPGSLPVINRRAVEYAIRAALALNADVQSESKFDRKNYYYPDLPKAYQISQYDRPLARDGELPVSVEGASSTVQIERLHMEEDAGKLIHAPKRNESYVDYNRAGTPLIEIVTYPDMETAAQAVAYLRTLKKRMEYIGVSDCNMNEGSLRCDANLSIRREDGSLGTKTEVKNMNSFRAVRRALEHEAHRQRRVIERGESVVQGTRLWDEDAEETRPMRTKEEEHDYRYFPEPDLVPVRVPDDWEETIREDLPEMPDRRRERMREEYDLTEEDVRTLTDSREMADLYENAVEDGVRPTTVCNLVKSDLRRELNDLGIEVGEAQLRAEHLGTVASLLDEDEISSNGASTLIERLVREGGDPEALVEELGLRQISDASALESVIDQVVDENPDAVEDVREGKGEAVGFLVGQVMQATEGQANPERANEMLRDRLVED